MKHIATVSHFLLLLLLLGAGTIRAGIVSDSINCKPDVDRPLCPIIADAGPDITVCACTQAVLNGSFAGSGGNFTYNWTATPFSGTAWLSNAHVLNPTISVACFFSGQMTFQLEVISGNPFCTSTDQVTVTVLEKPNPGVNMITPATCTMGGSFSGFATGGVPPYSFLWSNGATTSSPTDLPPGEYYVTVTDAQGCTGTGGFPISGPFPITPVVNNPTICGSGGSAVLTVTGGTYPGYAWSSGQNGNPITVTAPGTYTVTVTAASGCTKTAESEVTALPSPMPELNMPMLCTGMSVPLIVSGGFFTQANWSNGQGGSAINITASGTYTVTVTEPNGCTASISQTIIALPSPAPVINGPSSLCVGGMAMLSVTGGSFASINWSTGENSNTIEVTAPGMYTVTVTAANGCTGTTSKNITFLPLVLPAINGPVNLCLGGAATLTVTGGTFSSFNWSNGATTNVISITTPGTYDVTVTAANGCTGTASRAIATLPGPMPVLTGPASLCDGQMTSLLVTGGNFTTIDWSTGQHSNAININTSGTYSVTVTASNGCTESVSQTITAFPTPVPVIDGPAEICDGDVVTLEVNSGNLTSFTWSNGEGGSSINVTNPGTYSVTVTDANGCTGTDVQILTLLPSPVAIIDGPTGMCAGGTGILTAGSGNFSAVNWSTGQTSNAITINMPGTYTLVVTAANGCIDAISQTVATLPAPVPVVTGPTQLCVGGTATLTAGGGNFSAINWSTGQNSNAINIAAAGIYTVTVTNAEGCTGTSAATITGDTVPVPQITGDLNICSAGGNTLLNAGAFDQYVWSGGETTASITVSSPGTFTVTVTDLAGCTATNMQTVTTRQSPSPTISGPSSVCAGMAATLDAGTGFTTYQWASGETSRQIVSITAGVFTVTVSAANGCTGSATFPFDVLPQLVADAGPDQSVCPDQSATIAAGGGMIYEWNTGQTSANITVNPTVSTNYVVTVSAAGSCSATDTVLVKILPTSSGNLHLTLCANDSFLLAGSLFNAANPSGQVLLTGSNGCDSTLTVTLDFYPVFQENVHLQSCNPAQAGTTTQIFQSRFGCDSTVVTTITYNPNAIDTTQLQAHTCDPAMAGMNSVLTTGADGCDSLIITTTILYPSPVVVLQKTTCNPAQAGTTTQIFQSQFGCDSTVVTNTVFNPNAIDTTQLQAQTCDPTSAGTSTVLLTGVDGCDSLVITNTVLHPSPTVFLQKTTCNPAQAGTTTQIFQSQFGCDSTVVTNTVFNPNAIDTTQILAHTCDPAAAGITTVLMAGADGCDSLIITNTILHPSPTLVLQKTTCNPAQAGTTTQILQSQFGCDSIVVTNTVFNPGFIDSVQVLVHTCDPAAAGITVIQLTGADGCDSVVITNTVLHPSPTVFLQKTTCDPAQAGMTTQVFQTPFGCDSTVTINTLLQLSDTTFLNETTCDPLAAGISSVLFQNINGCDSLVITTVVYAVAGCNTFTAKIEGESVSCFGLNDGNILITALSGMPPFQFTWTNTFSGNTGTGVIPALNQTETITNLEGGTYEVEIADLSTLGEDTMVLFVIDVPFALSANAQAISDFHGFAVSCSSATDGAVEVAVSGGTPPYSINWSNGAHSVEVSGLPAGLEYVTVTDMHSCIRMDTLLLESPPPVVFDIQKADEKCFGDHNGSLKTTGIYGGIPPVEFSLNGGSFSSDTLWSNLAPGSYTLNARDAEGCETGISTIELLPGHLLDLDAGLDTIVLSGDTLLLTVATTFPVDTVIWSPGQAILPVSPTSVLAFPTVSTDFKVIAIDANGCFISDNLRVQVDHNRHLFAPNVICPNCADGQNGVFTIFGGDGIKGVDLLRVFDRWGELVFEQQHFPVNAPEFGWNGNHLRVPLAGNTGVYVFYAVVRLSDDSTVVMKGDVTVLR